MSDRNTSINPSATAVSKTAFTTSPGSTEGSIWPSLRSYALWPTLLVAAGTVHGQTAPTPSAPTNTDDNTASTQKLSDVVVEARVAPSSTNPTHTEPILDTPKTITVIDREVFEQQGATTLRDVLRNTPGITFQAGEGGTPAGDQLTVRGFSARTDIFIDGIRDTGGYARDSFNLEQVEVTKGPSSSDAGRGSTGGSINLVSKKPQLTSLRAGTAGFGTDEYFRSTIDVNEAVPQSPIAGTAVRVNAMYQDNDVPGRDVAHNSSWAVAPSLAFGLNTPTSVILSYLHLHQNNLPDYGLPWVPATNVALAPYAGGIPPVDFSNFYGLKKRDYEHVDNDLFTADLSHNFGDNFTLRNVTRFGETVRDSIITPPRFLSDNATTIRRSDWKSRDQIDKILANNTALTGTLSTGTITHDFAAGAQFSREESINYTRVKTGPDSPSTDLYQPNPEDAYTEAITRNGAFTKAVSKSSAVFAADTLKFGSQWEVSGALRWENFDTDYNSVTAAGVGAPLSREDDMLSWRAGIVYKPQENGSVYAGYGTSFNPSAEGLALTTSTVLIEPEKSRTYEVGTKWDIFNKNLSLSAALFRTEKSNARTPGNDPGDPPTVLEGKQHVQGVELGVSGKITRHWTAFAGYAYMDSEIANSNTAAELGKELPLTPKNTLNLWTTYEIVHGFSIGGGAQYMDTVYRNATNVSTVPSYWLYNAMASYEVNKSLSLRLNVYNLTDKHYVDRPSGGHFIPGQGRSAVLTANFQF
ncbi:MAG TPA: TonB-dependent siderophore receptor [Opitutaceae bacterium]|nr:TonB-dependent siderophore receptor [Opitutaceae bacterium]